MELRKVATRAVGGAFMALGLISFGRGAVIGMEQTYDAATIQEGRPTNSENNVEKLLFLGAGLAAIIGGSSVIIRTIEQEESLSFAEHDAREYRHVVPEPETVIPQPALSTTVGEMLQQEINLYYERVDSPVLAQLASQFDELGQPAQEQSTSLTK